MITVLQMLRRNHARSVPRSNCNIITTVLLLYFQSIGNKNSNHHNKTTYLIADIGHRLGIMNQIPVRMIIDEHIIVITATFTTKSSLAAGIFSAIV
eukprot:scaffold76745_cov49-Cyclotella_meneghiniana.AAC.2